MNKSIIIADDHPLFREAMSYIVSSLLPGCTIEEATNYSEVRSLLDKKNFTLVMLDLDMPDSNGLTDLALLKKLSPQTPIVVVSGHEEPDIIRSCLDHDASGYIIKSTGPKEIKSAIKMVLAGNTYIPASIESNTYNINNQSNISASKIQSLTPSQLKVLVEMGKGKLNKQIAYDLNITEATVKAHITTIFKKLKINNRTQAVLFTIENKTKHPELK